MMNINYKRYSLVHLIASLVLPLVLYAILTLGGFDFDSGATAIIPTMLAALFEGQKQSLTAETKPTSRALWRAALPLTAIALAINAVLLVAVLLFWPQFFAGFSEVNATMEVGTFLAGFAVIFTLLLLLLNRWFLSQGISNQIKATEAKAKRK